MASSNVKSQDEAFVTLSTNDLYARGALVLAESLKNHGTNRCLVIMITPQVSLVARSALENVFDIVKVVDVMDSMDAAHLALMKRPELGITFTKIHCWKLTEFKKCVFMDADMMALQNIDELFEREELSAVRDSGWPDIFNSGLFVFKPSEETFDGILNLAVTEGSFDGGDQGLLNSYFSDWSMGDITKHIPFLFNLHVSATYTYLPAFKKFGKDTKVVHFLGAVKPWHHVYNKTTGGVRQMTGPPQPGGNHFHHFLHQWWDIYETKIRGFFSKQETIVQNGSQSTTSDKSNCKFLGKDSVHEEKSKSNLPNWGLPHTFFKTSPSYSTAHSSEKSWTKWKTTSTVMSHLPNGHSEQKISCDVNIIPPTPSEQNLGEFFPQVNKTVVSQNVAKRVKSCQYLLHGDPNVLLPIVGTIKKGTLHNQTMSENSTLCDLSLIPSALIKQDPEPQKDQTRVSSTGTSVEDSLRAKWEHKSRWERGEIDYMGEDKFENIQALLDTYL